MFAKMKAMPKWVMASFISPDSPLSQLAIAMSA